MNLLKYLAICASVVVVTGCQLASEDQTPSKYCPVPNLVLPKASSQKDSPSNSLGTIDLRFMSPDTIPSKLRDAEPSDLVMISPEMQKNKSAMESIGAAKKVRFCMVARDLLMTRKVLDARIGTPHVFAVLPEAPEAIKGVFGRTSPRIEHYMKANVERFQNLSHVSICSDEKKSFRDTVMNEIRSGKSGDMFILVGHNDDGFIRGPDGTGVSVKDINDECHHNSRPAIILSCSTIRYSQQLVNGFVTPRDLEFDEMAYALKLTESQLTGRRSATLREFATSLSTSFEKLKENKRQKVVVILTVVGTAIIISTYEIECQDNDPGCVG